MTTLLILGLLIIIAVLLVICYILYTGAMKLKDERDFWIKIKTDHLFKK